MHSFLKCNKKCNTSVYVSGVMFWFLTSRNFGWGSGFRIGGDVGQEHIQALPSGRGSYRTRYFILGLGGGLVVDFGCTIRFDPC